MICQEETTVWGCCADKSAVQHMAGRAGTVKIVMWTLVKKRTGFGETAESTLVTSEYVGCELFLVHLFKILQDCPTR